MNLNFFYSILLSISPVSELRGGIPYALSHGYSIKEAFLICVIPNILIIFLIFLFLNSLNKFLLKMKWYNKLFNAYIKRLEKRKKKVGEKVERWGYIALCLFVAIPFPTTGAWTGTIIAWLLHLDKLKSFFAIAFGVIIAGIIVSLVSIGVISIF